MPRQAKTMPLAFDASQHLNLPVQRCADRLPAYLLEDDRLLAALLDERQLSRIDIGRYRYLVTSLQVFQLQVKPIVSLEINHAGHSMTMRAVDCELEGLGLVDDFQLTLEATLEATPKGLVGDANLAVRVSQPSLLRLIPRRILENTGQSILSGILVGIKARVGQQLMADFRQWCQSVDSNQSLEKAATMQSTGT